MADILNKVDTERLQELFARTELDVKYFNTMCMDVVDKYSQALDSLMSDLYAECIKNKDASVETLERYYLELSNMLYFMISKQEQLGVYADMSKTAAKEAYSKAYLQHQVKENLTGKNKNTVAELQSHAALDSQYEEVVNNIYDSAYKILRGKVLAAQDMMNCLRRILATRAAEMSMSSTAPNRSFPGDQGGMYQ